MTQYIHDNLLAEVVQPLEALVLIKDDIKEDKLKTVFKAYGKTVKDKADKVNKTKLLKLLVKKNYKNKLFCGSYFIKAYNRYS